MQGAPIMQTLPPISFWHHGVEQQLQSLAREMGYVLRKLMVRFMLPKLLVPMLNLCCTSYQLQEKHINSLSYFPWCFISSSVSAEWESTGQPTFCSITGGFCVFPNKCIFYLHFLCYKKRDFLKFSNICGWIVSCTVNPEHCHMQTCLVLSPPVFFSIEWKIFYVSLRGWINECQSSILKTWKWRQHSISLLISFTTCILYEV